MDKRRILVVDNNDGLRAMLADVLGGLGHDVVATGDRDEALGRDDLDKFDVIISDLTEDADSEQMIGELQRKRLLTPISANGRQQSEIVKAFKMGAGNPFSIPTPTTKDCARLSNRHSPTSSSVWMTPRSCLWCMK